MNIKKMLKNLWHCYLRNDRIQYAREMGVRIGEGCQLLCYPEKAFGTEPWLIKIGNHVDITGNVQFLTHEGGIWCARGIDPYYNEMDVFSPIVVGDNVLIGVGSLIMPGVTIGNNVIIAGHSVVTKDIPDGAIVAGMPAKQISTMEKFMEGLPQRNVVPTKKMTADEKRAYCEKKFPQWFQ